MTQKSIPEAFESQFTIHHPQPADFLESKWLGPLTIRRDSLLLCLGVTTANPHRAEAFTTEGTADIGPCALDLGPLVLGA